MRNKLLLLLLLCVFHITYSQKNIILRNAEKSVVSQELSHIFSSYSVHTMNVNKLSNKLSDEEIQLTFDLRDKTISADLQLTYSSSDDLIRIADESGIHELEPAPYYLYRGIDNRSAITISGNYLSGVIEDKKGNVWHIEPLLVHDKRAKTNEFILYAKEDIVDNSDHPVCLHDEVMDESIEHYARNRSGSYDPFCRDVELAIAIDYSFYQAYNSGNFLLPLSMLKVLSYYNVMQSRYNGIGAYQLNFLIKEWFISTCDTCTPWNPVFGVVDASDNYSNPFKAWAASDSGFQLNYDIPCAWTNRKIYNYKHEYQQFWGIGGEAGGAICDYENKVAIITDTAVFDVEYIGTRFAHEIGHVLGYIHDSTGSWVMSPTVNGTITNFSPESIDRFYHHLVGKNCLNNCASISRCPSIVEEAVPQCSLEWEWVKQAGGPQDDQANAIALDYDDHIYITGYYMDSAAFSNYTLSSCGDYCSQRNLFLSKYTRGGSFKWAANDCFEECTDPSPGDAVEPHNNEGLDLAAACNNDVAVGGYRTVHSYKKKDMYINRFTNVAERMEGVIPTENNGQTTNGVAVNSADQIISAGHFYKYLKLGKLSLENNGHLDGFVLIGNRYGEVEAESAIIHVGGVDTYSDAVNDVTVDDDDNIYFTGYFSGTAHLTDQYGNVFSIQATSEKDAFVAKSDDKGELLWVNTIHGSGDEIANAVAVDENGSVYITGGFDKKILTDLNQIVASGGSEDVFVAKFNTNGVLQWVRNGGGVGADVGYGIACSGTHVFVAGTFENTAHFSGTNSLISGGQKDILLLGYDKNGNLLSAKSAGGAGEDIATDVVVDESYSVYVTGSFETVAQFGNDQLVSNGGKDIYIAKLYAQLQVDARVRSAQCGQSDGRINISLEQGTGPFSIQWESIPGGAITGNTVLNGYASFNITNLPSGMYRITVSETNRCYEEELIVEVTDDCCMASQYSYVNTNSITECHEVIFTDQTTTNSGASPTYWYWTFGDGNTSSSQNPTHAYSAAGTYAVCLTTCTFGCCDVFCNEVIVDGCDTGPTIPNSTKNKMGQIEGEIYQVYPNPTEGLLYIDIGDSEIKEKEVIVQLYNQLGQEVLEQEINQSMAIDISSIENGMYILHILVDERQVYYQKLLKK